MKKILLSLVLVNLLAACASDKPKEAVVEPKAAAAQDDAAARAQAAADAEAVRVKAEADAAAQAAADKAKAEADAAAATEAAAKSALDKNSVHFPFDVATIQTEDKDTIVAHGKNLEANPQLLLCRQSGDINKQIICLDIFQ